MKTFSESEVNLIVDQVIGRKEAVEETSNEFGEHWINARNHLRVEQHKRYIEIIKDMEEGSTDAV